MFNTRIAPSPTGDMHIGTARTAYLNWLAARSTGGKFYLRIDDTDQVRSKPEFVEVIKDTMTWLGLTWDELVFQSQRFDRYKAALSVILKNLVIEEGAVKLRLYDHHSLPNRWTDQVVGEVKITESDLADMDVMVLIKSDGSPTYNWASVVDDLDFRINLVVRGTDHVTNTSKQVILWHLMGATIPEFAHVGLIAQGGKPLSKREGAASMMFYRDKGYDPDAVLNFLVRMGWSPTVDDKTTKMLPREKLLNMFLSGGKMRSSLANMDLAKLEAFDRKYKAAKKIWRTGERLLKEGEHVVSGNTSGDQQGGGPTGPPGQA
jgi:glutamyl-tRNA synthetase